MDRPLVLEDPPAAEPGERAEARGEGVEHLPPEGLEARVSPDDRLGRLHRDIELPLDRVEEAFPIPGRALLHRDARALAWRLDGYGPDDGAWKAVVAITRGGMAPAMIVARELDIRTVDTISVKSYDHQDQSAAKILKSPDMDLMGDGTGILIIDDLVDSGKTLDLVRKMYPNAHFATVYAKPAGRDTVDSYITEVSQDTWILFPWDQGPQFVEPIVNVKRD